VHLGDFTGLQKRPLRLRHYKQFGLYNYTSGPKQGLTFGELSGPHPCLVVEDVGGKLLEVTPGTSKVGSPFAASQRGVTFDPAASTEGILVKTKFLASQKRTVDKDRCVQDDDDSFVVYGRLTAGEFEQIMGTITPPGSIPCNVTFCPNLEIVTQLPPLVCTNDARARPASHELRHVPGSSREPEGGRVSLRGRGWLGGDGTNLAGLKGCSFVCMC
jgi:hypothetical protein